METPPRRAYRPKFTELPPSDSGKDAGLDEKTRITVEQNVGRLTVRYDGRSTPSQSSGFLTKYNDKFFVVTARHCINPNYGSTNYDIHQEPYATRQRYLCLPRFGEIPLEEAKYFEDIQNGQTPDIAVMLVSDNIASQFPLESGLDILPHNEALSNKDDEAIYFAGFPHNEFLLSTTQAKMNGQLGSTKGVSGGPVFIIKNGKVRVLSIITGTDDQGKFVVPSRETFAPDVRELMSLF